MYERYIVPSLSYTHTHFTLTLSPYVSRQAFQTEAKHSFTADQDWEFMVEISVWKKRATSHMNQWQASELPLLQNLSKVKRASMLQPDNKVSKHYMPKAWKENIIQTSNGENTLDNDCFFTECWWLKLGKLCQTKNFCSRFPGVKNVQSCPSPGSESPKTYRLSFDKCRCEYRFSSGVSQLFTCDWFPWGWMA